MPAAKALALKDKRDRDINMLAETLGVSIETARAAAHGDFVVDREHNADMAWTSAPITPRTADETLAQLHGAGAAHAHAFLALAYSNGERLPDYAGSVREFVEEYVSRVADQGTLELQPAVVPLLFLVAVVAIITSKIIIITQN